MSNLKLSIKDIADLKEGRKTLQQITKTHDGTSSGPIRPALKEFITNHTNSFFRVEQLLTSEGKPISYREGTTNEDHEEEEMYDYSNLKKVGETNMHMIIKSSSETIDNGINGNAFIDKDGKTYDMFTTTEMEKLLLRDDDGNDLLQSITKVTDRRGNSMTIIKSNDFNRDAYDELCGFPDALMKRTNNRINEYRDEMIKWAESQGATNPYNFAEVPGFDKKREQVSNALDKKYGTIEDYIEKEWGDLIEESGVKIKYQKNDNVTPKEIDNYNEYVNHWEEEYEDRFIDDDPY